MCFQLGRPRLSCFKKMIAAIESFPPQYDRAAGEMHNSRWQILFSQYLITFSSSKAVT